MIANLFMTIYLLPSLARKLAVATSHFLAGVLAVELCTVGGYHMLDTSSHLGTEVYGLSLCWCLSLHVAGAGAAAAAENHSSPASARGGTGRRDGQAGEGEQGPGRQPVRPQGQAPGGAAAEVNPPEPCIVFQYSLDSAHLVVSEHDHHLKTHFPISDTLNRKLLEQREEELHQQFCVVRTKEASLTHANSDLTHRMQQLETRLQVLESEQHATREEVGVWGTTHD